MAGKWALPSDDLEEVFSREAMRLLAFRVAAQAELLADEIEAGRLEDRGGAEALRLLAALMRLNGDGSPAMGRA